MALCQHGHLLFRYRSPRPEAVLPRIRRRDPHMYLLQHAGCHLRVLLQHIWPAIWPPPDGTVALLVWLVWRQADRLLQRPCMYRLERCQQHRWRAANPRCKRRRPRLGWHPRHRHRHPSRNLLWLQGSPRLRVLELDPDLHRFPHRPRRIRALGCFRQHPHGRGHLRTWRRPQLRKCCVWLRNRVDELRRRLHRVPARYAIPPQGLRLRLDRPHDSPSLH